MLREAVETLIIALKYVRAVKKHHSQKKKINPQPFAKKPWWNTKQAPKVEPVEEASGIKALMPVNEAIQILQVPEPYTLEIIDERFAKLFKINDPKNGGSFYIQCKIMGAKLTLIQSLTPKEQDQSKPTPNEQNQVLHNPNEKDQNIHKPNEGEK
jgi:Pam16